MIYLCFVYWSKKRIFHFHIFLPICSSLAFERKCMFDFALCPPPPWLCALRRKFNLPPFHLPPPVWNSHHAEYSFYIQCTIAYLCGMFQSLQKALILAYVGPFLIPWRRFPKLKSTRKTNWPPYFVGLDSNEDHKYQEGAWRNHIQDWCRVVKCHRYDGYTRMFVLFISNKKGRSFV